MTVDIFSPSTAEKLAASRKALIHTFKEGQAYVIYSSGNIGTYGGKKSSGYGNTSWEKDCIFIYLRKVGKHHVFRELHGGWTRTYTDAQLIGKKIKEVNT